MRIDLHCHTKSVKSGDGDGRNVTVELFREKIIDADVKVVAITNHNLFDYEQYQSFKQAVNDCCQVWPGVEIDVIGSNEKRWHLIVVANPDNAEIFSDKVTGLFNGKNLETCTLTIKEIYNSLNNCNVIYISHFHKKPAISEEDRMELLQLVNDASRVFNETPDHRSLGVFANYDYSVLIGSDVKDWSKYEQSTFAELRLSVSSFPQFCLLAKRDPVIVNTLLNQRQSYDLIASPHKSVHFPLKIFEDVNIIFGQKGTGKSEILNSLYSEMVAKGICCEKYTGSEKDDDFSTLLKTKDMEVDLSKVDAKSCDDEFSYIFSWSDSNPTLFANYFKWYNTKDNNANKSRMKITEAADLAIIETEQYQIHVKDRNHIKTVIKEIGKISTEDYIEKPDGKKLQELIGLLNDEIISRLTYDVIEKNSCELVNFSIDKIKAIADKNSDTVSKPSSTGFREFAQGRFKLLRNVETILKNISLPKFDERVPLGELEGKGNIYIIQRYRMLCEDSKTVEFSNKITALKALYSLLQDAKKQIFCHDISSTLNNFSTGCEENSITSTKAYLGLSKQVVTEDGTEYSPSNGEKGILLLQQKLSKEADAYFLDEPELGMGNSYIDTNIRPIISALAKRHKVIVVATHNANIAVRTLPYMSIFRIHQNGDYTTYVGNPFNDCLVNIDNQTDIKSWTTESLHTLEGGKEAFYERKNIYESKNN